MACERVPARLLQATEQGHPAPEEGDVEGVGQEHGGAGVGAEDPDGRERGKGADGEAGRVDENVKKSPSFSIFRQIYTFILE